jgi:predicted phosphoribosyltransferase
MTPEDFFAVGEWYLDFTQTTDFEVKELLEQAERLAPSAH